VSGSGIRWAICKSTPRSRQITTPAPHHSVFYRPDALPNQQRQGTAGSNCCTTVFLSGPTEVDGKPAGKCYTTGYYAERTYRPTAVIKSVLKRYGVRPSGRSIARKRQPSASALPYSPRTQSVFGFNNKIFQLGIWIFYCIQLLRKFAVLYYTLKWLKWVSVLLNISKWRYGIWQMNDWNKRQICWHLNVYAKRLQHTERASHKIMIHNGNKIKTTDTTVTGQHRKKLGLPEV